MKKCSAERFNPRRKMDKDPILKRASKWIAKLDAVLNSKMQVNDREKLAIIKAIRTRIDTAEKLIPKKIKEIKR